jgi:hypothetical protein
MKPIPMTYFLDFVSKAGTPKLTVVKKFKKDIYDPQTDFWKKLREGIVKYHEEGHAQKNWLDGIANGITDPKKLGLYPTNISAYKTFLGKKSLTWFNPPRAIWTFSQISVLVNPELGLELNGVRHLIKLYFKAEKLSSNKIQLIQLLMQQAVGNNKGFTFSVLDVPRNNLFSESSPDLTLLPLLEGEATNFELIFNRVP